MPTGKRVLIVGAGVSGSIVAFWLGRHGFDVLVVERAQPGSRYGQGIEIEEPALQVIRAMGVLEQLEKVATGETGFEVVDQHGKTRASFGVGRVSLTGALEMMRGDLTEVLYKAADESSNVRFEFNTTLLSLRQTGDTVVVDTETRGDSNIKSREFDLVIGADGARSRTRQLILGSSEQHPEYFRSLGVFTAYFSIPKEPQDSDKSQLFHYPGGRTIWLRPTSPKSGITSALLICCQNDLPKLRAANATTDREKQKEALAEVYGDLNGWQIPRILEQMAAAKNFYSEELVQIRLPRWSQNRVVLVGDAAWAPTPFSGEGNQLAIMGAWILAQEITRDQSPGAFAKYETRFRSYVEKSQDVPWWIPRAWGPDSSAGIWLLRTICFVVAGLVRLAHYSGLLSLFPESKRDDFDLQIDKEKDHAKITSSG